MLAENPGVGVGGLQFPLMGWHTHEHGLWGLAKRVRVPFHHAAENWPAPTRFPRLPGHPHPFL